MFYSRTPHQVCLQVLVQQRMRTTPYLWNQVDLPRHPQAPTNLQCQVTLSQLDRDQLDRDRAPAPIFPYTHRWSPLHHLVLAQICRLLVEILPQDPLRVLAKEDPQQQLDLDLKAGLLFQCKMFLGWVLIYCNDHKYIYICNILTVLKWHWLSVWFCVWPMK